MLSCTTVKRLSVLLLHSDPDIEKQIERYEQLPSPLITQLTCRGVVYRICMEGKNNIQNQIILQ